MSKLLINLSFLLKEPTGVSVYAQNVFPYLAPLAPTLLASQDWPGFNRYLVSDQLTPAQGSRGHFNRLVWTETQLPQIYRKLQADLLFSPVPEAPLIQPCRSVVMVHDLIPLRFPRWRSPLTYYCRFYLPQVLKRATHILCNSQATAADLIDFFQIPAAKITPILLGHDPSRFFCPDPRESPRPYFLYLGRLDPHKNLARLIQAFAQIPEEYELWCAGPPDPRYRPGLTALGESLGFGARLRWLDYVPPEDLPLLLHRATALVFPSLWEGFGFPALEAMACGTAVITSNCSSLPEVTGEAALLVNPYDVEDIAGAMKRLIEEPGLRSELVQKGLARAKELTWAETGRQTRECLEKWL
ncbi:MAG: glycosyltransferase [Cyanobacteria bacterium RI_101]|nr:glycosyltransferase [Cyanobacteria bacterium RI_101]